MFKPKINRDWKGETSGYEETAGRTMYQRMQRDSESRRLQASHAAAAATKRGRRCESQTARESPMRHTKGELDTADS